MLSSMVLRSGCRQNARIAESYLQRVKISYDYKNRKVFIVLVSPEDGPFCLGTPAPSSRDDLPKLTEVD